MNFVCCQASVYHARARFAIGFFKLFRETLAALSEKWYYKRTEGVDALEFEWDENKAAANWKKHGISFFRAARVFEDENRKEYYDIAHSDDEDRYITIGLADDVLFVVYVERREKVRIISARYANRQERKLYYDY